MLLEVNNLSVVFHYPEKKVLDNVSLKLQKGQKLGIVGESGGGKSTLIRTLAGFQSYKNGKVTIQNKLIKATLKDRKWISRELQMIFQDPLSSLNPRQTMQQALEEPLLNFTTFSKEERKQRILNIIEDVNLHPSILRRYSDSISGGQAQRICIARSLLANPEILICDEPITSLDMVTQIQILKLLERFGNEKQISIIFVSHDISHVLKFCDEVLVIRDGRVVDYFKVGEWQNENRNGYTKKLMESTRII
ncbi:ABC transporter ATP-binding protein [Virgibacillus chiguensis]|uniref:Peptide/nickel transport system ATP-binding protein n=1 Tax=Virgibacillus chiguensis TaxID=411959 RepID=A0A1M5MFG2_9BACI|nr:dipeptide/oligopeptide/nickel ABC transporter ATP-binding protein [Virgibacillus chiguensis]SHG75609.1 peptide/nickel transport system ATP-binding protein [Virgibacillus chiguensis]